MKRGKILIWVLAGVITTGLLISSFISYKSTNKYGGDYIYYLIMLLRIQKIIK